MPLVSKQRNEQFLPKVSGLVLISYIWVSPDLALGLGCLSLCQEHVISTWKKQPWGLAEPMF